MEDAHRREWAFVLATTARLTGDVDLAEECVQEAYIAALDTWARAGVPDNPGAWLTTTAKRKALNALQRSRNLRSKLPLLTEADGPDMAIPTDGLIPDDRLRLVFTCCHPTLAPEAQIALTLRLVCGMGTGEIARAFLVSEPTMAARLTRAKKKISAARIPYRVPLADELPDRLDAVLMVIHLLYSTGHTAPSSGQLVREDLITRALDLARMLLDLMPGEPEVRGLLALLLVTDARRCTRTDEHGHLILLKDQDRSAWDRVAITEGHLLIVDALGSGRAGKYTLQAAIATLHAVAKDYQSTDWSQMLILYDELLKIWRSPVVALNRSVAMAMVEGPEAGLIEIQALEAAGHLARYHYLPAAKAELLRRLGRYSQAASAYQTALDLTDNETERAFLATRFTESSPDRDPR